MGFLAPKAPRMPPVPPPPPPPAVEGVDKGKLAKEASRLKRRQGVKATMITGTGLTTEEGAKSTYKPTLIG